MANPAADPKAAPLSDDLKELALSLPTTAFPKNLFCALCNQLAIDSYKLLCCNKAICSSCQAKLNFPTTCPSCDHSPLEADSCTPNKALRNTMRVWLQKQKKKEDAKAAANVATAPVEATPAAPETSIAGEALEKTVESVEDAQIAEDVSTEQVSGAADTAGETGQSAASASVQPNEDPTSPEIKTERRGSSASQNVAQSIEPSTVDGPAKSQDSGNTGMNPVMNGMQGQMGFGLHNQAGFNVMGWNGMNHMSGMSNMIANGNWNGMNSMDFNNMNGMPNGMFSNFGGNMGMGMGMNDMSAMNMMNYGGGYSNGWNGMGGGYGDFNGHNSMGGYNQSGAYPEMMNQFPKNNFPNQNQNRFHANQGGSFPQRNNRNGSHGGFGPGIQNANSRPGSRSGPAHNRDGQSPDGTADPATEAKADGEQTKASAESTEEGKEVLEGAPSSTNPQAPKESSLAGEESKAPGNETDQAPHALNEPEPDNNLKPIQTVDSGDTDMQDYDQSMMGNGMQPDMSYSQGMMNQYVNQAQQMNSSFDPNLNMNMGYHNNNYGSRSGFNNGAYGDATVLTGPVAEPVGVGVVGAPTGPRAMREGRPNTGFSSRANNTWQRPISQNVTPAKEAAPSSPQRRVRSKSPMRDETLRVKEKSPTRSRSRSRSRARDEEKDNPRDRLRSVDRDTQRQDRGRSPTPQVEDDREPRKERRDHGSSRYADRDDERDNRRRDDRDSRGDRTRSASVESKYRSSRHDKEKHRSSRSHRDRSKDHRRRHRTRSPAAGDKYEDDEPLTNGEKDSDGSSRRKHRNGDKEKHRDRDRVRSRDRDHERDRKDRKDRDRDYEYERDKDRSRDKDRDRRRRRDRETEDNEREYDEDKHRSSRRSRKDRDRERDRARDRNDRDEREPKEKNSRSDREDDIVGQMMKKRAGSPPRNAPTGPAANSFSIKGRSKNSVMPPPQPPTGPRAFQPPKGPAADRNRDRSDLRDQRRKSSASSVPGTPSTPNAPTSTAAQDHYAAERERNARERDSRDKPSRDPSSSSKAPLLRTSSSRPSLTSKRSRDDIDELEAPRGPKADAKLPTGPASHRDKRRKSGANGNDNIANLFTAGLRKNAKARRGGVRTEGDVEREMERVERERERR